MGWCCCCWACLPASFSHLLFTLNLLLFFFFFRFPFFPPFFPFPEYYLSLMSNDSGGRRQRNNERKREIIRPTVLFHQLLGKKKSVKILKIYSYRNPLRTKSGFFSINLVGNTAATAMYLWFSRWWSCNSRWCCFPPFLLHWDGERGRVKSEHDSVDRRETTKTGGTRLDSQQTSDDSVFKSVCPAEIFFIRIRATLFLSSIEFPRPLKSKKVWVKRNLFSFTLVFCDEN